MPLCLWFVFSMTGLAGADLATVTDWVGRHYNPVLLILFIICIFHHGQLGLQVVIEDYVHHKGWRTGLLLGNAMFCGAFGLAGVFAVLKIAFTA